MKKLTMLTAAALVAATPLMTTQAEARYRGGAIAAGVVGGLAAGALIGAATGAYAAPVYGYPAYAPAYAYNYDYDYEPVAVYRPTRVVRRVHTPRRVYRTARVVDPYPYGSAYFGFGPSYPYAWGGPRVRVGFGYGSSPYWW